ncbi:MAG: ArnT family glycosyltransferase, partial [Phycisphaerales bacterium JB041]
MNAAVAWVCARRWRQVLLLVIVSAAIFLPRLGATGLSMSEGHRAIPAWEMLEDTRAGDAHWLVPRMFETAYLRKPPGMLWAIAGSTAVFGETEFAARFPSALSAMLLGIAVWWFATRWFG